MKRATLLLACIALLSGCGFQGQGKRDAITHFNSSRVAIESFAEYYRTNSALTYVEFKAENLVDLWILHKDASWRSATGSRFKHQLYGAPLNSTLVSNALAYADVSEGTLLRLRELAASAGCISAGTPVSDSYPWEVEIGYARSGLSKYIFRKFKHSVDVTYVVSRPPWRDDCLAQLSNNWVLVMGSPAFN